MARSNTRAAAVEVAQQTSTAAKAATQEVLALGEHEGRVNDHPQVAMSSPKHFDACALSTRCSELRTEFAEFAELAQKW